MKKSALVVAVVTGWLLVGAVVAAPQGAVAPNRFFLGSGLQTPNGIRSFVFEYDEAGVLVAAHDFAPSLAPGFGTPGNGHLRPCEVSPWGTVLCSTSAWSQGGWFEMEANGYMGQFYSNRGQLVFCCDGAAGIAASPSGLLAACDYGAGWGANLRGLSSTGSSLWSVPANEALGVCFHGGDIYVSSFQVRPITRWDTNGNSLGSFGTYRNVYFVKSLINNELLIGHNPGGGQTHWIIHDVATGVDNLLTVASSGGADVDDAGNFWILQGANLVGYQAGSTTPSVTISLSTGITDHFSLAISGSPVFGSPASYAPFGLGCPGPSGATPTLFAPPGEAPVIGASSLLRVSNLPLSVTVPVFIFGFSTTQATGPAGNYPLPFDLGVLGWPGCSQLVSLNDSVYTITTTGSADHTVTLPPFAFLAGLQFHAQSLVLYSGGEVAVTNGITATAGW